LLRRGYPLTRYFCQSAFAPRVAMAAGSGFPLTGLAADVADAV
jgi:hypothetical protein